MRLETADRRRLAWASVVTVAALPALWFVNKESDANRPNVAAVGLAADDGGAPVTTVGPIDPLGDPDVSPATIIAAPPTSATTPPQIRYGTADDALVARVDATFRRSVGDPEACWYNGVSSGDYITVLNPANGRSIECWTVLRHDDPPHQVVLYPSAFAELARFTDAPVTVEIRQ